ncbi:MAG: hypothetical protein ABIO70_30810 [Pseudomonadota bacterium]
MLSLLWLAALAGAAQADCGDFPTLVNQAEQALIAGRVEPAAATLRQAEAALGCGPVPAREVLARMWLAQGTQAYLQGDEKVSHLVFAAAGRVAPDVWVEGYGPQVHQIYLASRTPEPGEGNVRVRPDPAGWSSALDGLQVGFPVDAPAGLHLLQVGPDAQHTGYAEIFYLPAGQTYFVLTGLTPPAVAEAPEAPPAPEVPAVAEAPEAPPAPEAPTLVEAPAAPALPVEPLPVPKPPRVRSGHASPVFLVVGGAAAAGALVTAIPALKQNAVYDDPDATRFDVEMAYWRQRMWGPPSYALMGVTAASLGLYLAFSF